LGQHFLIHGGTASKLVRSLGIEPGEPVLEIGPGRGMLTGRLLAAGARVLAVEIDGKLVEKLQRDLADPIGEGSLRLVEGDIIDFDIEGWAGETGEAVKLLGNLPYSQTRPILEKLIDSRRSIGRAVVTVQAEVGRRLLAGPGGRDYGSLSVFVQYYARPGIVADVPARYFRPIPKVDSLAVSLDFYDKCPIAVEDEELFFKIVRTAFNQRRKTVRNALSAFFDSYDFISEPGDFLAAAGIDPGLRPEALALADYAGLANRLNRMIDPNQG
jgi:16S rRNA (adenine1518-N6/adenine1519-N6)-dimethyltransferase